MDTKSFVCGGLASIFAEFCTFPVDMTKTRLQLQGENIGAKTVHFSGGRYNGMLHAMYMITKTEGVSTIYRGLSAALLRQSIYGTIKFGVYARMKRYFADDHLSESLFHNILCGVTAGVVSSSIANPTDLIKIRMQGYINVKSLESNVRLTSIVKDLLRKEGVLGLYKGVVPTATRAAIVCGVELPVYDVVKKHLILKDVLQDSVPCHFVSSFVAGLFGALISNPVDVIRTRLMSSGSKGSMITSALYNNAFECLNHILRHEGVSALWKGFIPNWLRLGPWNIIFFVNYEQLKRLKLWQEPSINYKI